jgi:hypothetical protein
MQAVELMGVVMSKRGWLRLAACVLVAAFLWVRIAPVEGGINRVLIYALSGTIAGLGLTWIGRTFASVPFTKRTALLSAGFGFIMLTPVIAAVLRDSEAQSEASVVVLAVSAAATAAMWGAVWRVMHLARDAFNEWRRENGSTIKRLTLGEAYL